MKFVLLAILLVSLVRETTQVPTPSSQHGCKFWSSLAYNLTHIHEKVGDIMHMYCENDNNTDGGGCKEMKCGGRFQQMIPIISRAVVKFNFCFGFRLNHCDNPVSMSYFFVVPDRNVSLKGILTHNDSYEIPGGKFQGIDTTVIVTIEMNKKDTQHIEFGITGEIRAGDLFGSPLFDPKMTVFPPTLIDILPCPADAKDKKPPAPFEPLKQCGLPTNYSTLTQPVTKPFIITSQTYNKSCEFGIPHCSDNEMCQQSGSRSRNGICVCQPLSELNPASGRCEMSFTSLLTTTGLPVNGSGSPSVTQASTSKNGSLSVVAIAVICVVGGLLLIVVIASIVIYIGRRKRSAIYRDRHQLLTTEDDDDDVNMVI